MKSSLDIELAFLGDLPNGSLFVENVDNEGYIGIALSEQDNGLRRVIMLEGYVGNQSYPRLGQARAAMPVITLGTDWVIRPQFTSTIAMKKNSKKAILIASEGGLFFKLQTSSGLAYYSLDGEAANLSPDARGNAFGISEFFIYPSPSHFERDDFFTVIQMK